jgi:hypothetical protein
VTVTDLMASLQKPAVRLLIERAGRDDAYRSKLIKQPRAALEEVLGEKIPDSITVVAHENTPTRLNVVLDPTLMAQVAAAAGPLGPIEQVLKKAHADPAFRKRLVQDPRGAVYDAVGLEIPRGLQVTVFENTADTMHLAVAARADTSAELSDAELEQVAGGKQLTSGGGTNPLAGLPSCGTSGGGTTTSACPGGAVAQLMFISAVRQLNATGTGGVSAAVNN